MRAFTKIIINYYFFVENFSLGHFTSFNYTQVFAFVRFDTPFKKKKRANFKHLKQISNTKNYIIVLNKTRGYHTVQETTIMDPNVTLILINKKTSEMSKIVI
jgi:hypothetical protein